LTVSPDGGEVFVSVLRSRGGEPTHVVLAEDAATGARRWASHDTGPISFTDETPITVAAAPDGSAIFVAGTAEGRDRATRFGTLAYDPATGALLWARRSAGAPGAHAVANAFAVSPDGSKVFVSGQTSSGRPTVYATVAYRAATGATVWTRTYAGPAGGYNAANAIAVTSDGGRVYVTGESAGQGGDVDVATLAYRAVDGTKVWGSRFGGPSSGDGRALAVAVGPNGRRVFVAGVSDQGGAQYFLTIAYRG
jgi:DNA-binding beta-propeller fold protein YncE